VASRKIACERPRGSRLRRARVGALLNLTADDPQSTARLAAFAQGLQEAGWSIGHNIQIETRWSAGDSDRARRYAAELLALAPEVILADGSLSVASMLRASRTVPIVFANVIDPVGAGFVTSLAQPGGNAIGFTAFEYGISGKWLELLKEIAPHMTRAAVLRDPALAAGIGQFAAIQSNASSSAVELSAIDTRDVGG
jgi:putative tryptophan/tyrosine transport system substrate-binding protein